MQSDITRQIKAENEWFATTGQKHRDHIQVLLEAHVQASQERQILISERPDRHAKGWLMRQWQVKTSEAISKEYDIRNAFNDISAEFNEILKSRADRLFRGAVAGNPTLTARLSEIKGYAYNQLRSETLRNMGLDAEYLEMLDKASAPATPRHERGFGGFS